MTKTYLQQLIDDLTPVQPVRDALMKLVKAEANDKGEVYNTNLVIHLHQLEKASRKLKRRLNQF